MRLDEQFNPVEKPKHKRGNPKRSKRDNFSKKVRDQIKEHFDNTCQQCGIQREGLHIHHVQPKGSSVGRGVFTNGLLVCPKCHTQVIHGEQEQTYVKYWQKVFREKYGHNFYKDERDIKEEARAKALYKKRQFNNNPSGWLS